MFDGHPVALTGWLEADQAELTVMHRPEDEGALEGHRVPLLEPRGPGWSPRALSHACVPNHPRGLSNFDDQTLRPAQRFTRKKQQTARGRPGLGLPATKTGRLGPNGLTPKRLIAKRMQTPAPLALL